MNITFSTVSNFSSLLGLAISIWTLINTSSIKKAVDNKLNLLDLSDNLQNYLDEIDKFIQLMSSNNFTSLNKNQRHHLRGLFMDIPQRYPNLNRTIQNDCQEAITILNKPYSCEFTHTELDNIIRCLRTLKNLLPMEVR